MNKYTQLTNDKRYQIFGLKQAGLNQTEIAQNMGVHKSTVSREFRRNEGQGGWRPEQAQLLRDERKQSTVNGKHFSLLEMVEVERLIRNDLSPEQVANRLELEGSLRISHETIYQFVYADKRNGGDMHLLCVARNPAASVMQAAKSGGAQSRTVSALMNGPKP